MVGSVMRPLLLGELCKQRWLDMSSCTLHQIQQLKECKPLSLVSLALSLCFLSLSLSLSGSAVRARFTTGARTYQTKRLAAWVYYCTNHDFGKEAITNQVPLKQHGRSFYRDGLKAVVVATAKRFPTRSFS